MSNTWNDAHAEKGGGAKKFAGLFLLIAVGATVGIWQKVKSDDVAPPDQPTVDSTQSAEVPSAGKVLSITGKAGSEKIDFLRGEDLTRYLKSEHNLTIDVSKAGSVEMVRQPPEGQHFLWPASQTNLETYQESKGVLRKWDNLLNSPIVLYSWDLVTDALLSTGIVEQVDGVYFINDFPRLIGLITDKQDWKALGLNQLYGKIAIKSTDPTRSNSGNMFAALLANTLNGGEVITADKLDAVLPEIEEIFKRQGHMEHSSGVLFNMYLSQGVGAFPIIVGYENQLIEFSLKHPESAALLKQKLRILYPKPTVWATHPFIAVDDQGVRLLEALKQPAAQKIAWEKHGFRSGIPGLVNDPSVFNVAGLTPTIQAVMPTPDARVMDRITEVLSTP